MPSKIFQANELNVMNSYESLQKKSKYLLNYSSFQLFSQRADYDSPTLWTAEQCEHSSGAQPSPQMLLCQHLGSPGSGLASQQHNTQYLLLLLWRSPPQEEAGRCHPLPRTVRKWHGSATSASYRSSRSPGSPNNVYRGTQSLHQGSWPPFVAERALAKNQGSAFIWWPDSFVKHGFTLGIKKNLSLHSSSAHRTI